MTRDELLAELQRLAQANEQTNPNAAIALYTLRGALLMFADDKLASVIRQWVRGQLGAMRN